MDYVTCVWELESLWFYDILILIDLLKEYQEPLSLNLHLICSKVAMHFLMWLILNKVQQSKLNLELTDYLNVNVNVNDFFANIVCQCLYLYFMLFISCSLSVK